MGLRISLDRKKALRLARHLEKEHPSTKGKIMVDNKRKIETPFSSRNLRKLEKTGITVRELVGKDPKLKAKINVRRKI